MGGCEGCGNGRLAARPYGDPCKIGPRDRAASYVDVGAPPAAPHLRLSGSPAACAEVCGGREPTPTGAPLQGKGREEEAGFDGRW